MNIDISKEKKHGSIYAHTSLLCILYCTWILHINPEIIDHKCSTTIVYYIKDIKSNLQNTMMIEKEKM